MQKAETLAKKAIINIMDASKSLNPEKKFGRRFDNFFEQGNGSEVMRIVMNEYYENENLQRAMKKADRWIGIETQKKNYPKQAHLFS